DAVEPDVTERRAVLEHARRQMPALAFAVQAAHLEDVRVVRSEHDAERQHDRTMREVRDANQLAARGVPEELPAEDVHLAARNGEPPVELEIRVRPVDAEDRVLVADVRVQEQRPPPGDRQLESRQEPRVAEVDAVLAVSERMNVAEAVEDGEDLVVLEHALLRVDA